MSDERRYAEYLPGGGGRKWVRCCCTRQFGIETRQCNYRQRADRHRRAIQHGVFHECNFSPAGTLLDRFIRNHEFDVDSVALDKMAIFTARHNIPIGTGASDDFRELLEQAYADGFRAGVAHPKADIAVLFRAYCPPMKETALRQRILKLAAEKQRKRLMLFEAVPYAALTIDAGQILSVKLFVINLVASSIAACSTFSIDEIDSLDHISLRELLVNKIQQLRDKDIIISAITCDGASYQVKALNFTDDSSLQARHATDADLRKVLFIPCLCHRVNNAYRHLPQVSALFCQLIQSLRSLGNFCRKPRYRKVLPKSCPQFIATRWVYDYRILRFVLDHEAEIGSIGDRDHRVLPEFRAILPLLETFYQLIGQLEAENTDLAKAYPILCTAMTRLQSTQLESESPAISEIYAAARTVLGWYVLDSTSDLLPLAYVLTPLGHAQAGDAVRTALRGGTIRAEVLALPGTADGALAVGIEETDRWRRVRIPLLPRGYDGLDPEIPMRLERDQEEEDSPRETEAGEDHVGEEEDCADATDSNLHLPDEIVEIEAIVDEPGDLNLATHARLAIARIGRQWGLDDGEFRNLLGAFDRFLATPDEYLFVTSAPDGSRYNWLSPDVLRGRFGLLAEIALRLEPINCSEAASERAIGTQRRIMAPHRMRTRSDLLLALTELQQS